MMNKQKCFPIWLLLIAAVGGIIGCSKQPQDRISTKLSAPPAVKSDSCSSISVEREKDLREAVEVKKKLVNRILRSDVRMKGAKLYITADVDLECKILEAPGAFVNVAGDYAHYKNPKQKLIVDGLVKKHSDNLIQIYNNIGNNRS